MLCQHLYNRAFRILLLLLDHINSIAKIRDGTVKESFVVPGHIRNVAGGLEGSFYLFKLCFNRSCGIMLTLDIKYF